MSELGSPGIAGDTAKLRREQRRRKLLMTSEERMRKIMGVSQNCEGIKRESRTLYLGDNEVQGQAQAKPKAQVSEQFHFHKFQTNSHSDRQ